MIVVVMIIAATRWVMLVSRMVAGDVIMISIVVTAAIIGLFLSGLVDRRALGYAGVMRFPHHIGVWWTAEYPLQCFSEYDC